MTTKTLDFQIEQVVQDVERANAMADVPTPNQFARQRVASAAGSLSRAGAMRARLDVAVAAMARLAAALYEQDEDGLLPNVDHITKRILIPVPWGANGWQHYDHIRQWEARVLRQILIERCQQRRRLPPLFDYNDQARTWHLNTVDYPTYDQAVLWLKRESPRLAEWREGTEGHRRYQADRR